MIKAKQLPSGSWRVQLYLGKDADGKRMFKSFTTETPEEAEYQAADYRFTRREKSKPMNLTVGEAIDRYIDTKTNVLSPSTITAYRMIRKNNLTELMPVRLGDLTLDDVQIAINVEAAGHKPKTVRNQYGLLKAALTQYHPSFSVKNIKLPQRVKTEIVVPEQSMIDALISAVRGKPLELPVILAACMGLRRSEICALTAADYDREKKLLHITKAMVQNEDNLWVVKTTKTYSSTRILTVPDKVSNILDCAAHGKATKDRLTSMSPAVVSETFSLTKKRLGFRVRFHDLRHYFSSVLLALGVPDKYAMEQTGHATPNMLKTVYQHTMADKRKEVSDLISAKMNSILQHEIHHDSRESQQIQAY